MNTAHAGRLSQRPGLDRGPALDRFPPEVQDLREFQAVRNRLFLVPPQVLALTAVPFQITRVLDVN